MDTVIDTWSYHDYTDMYCREGHAFILSFAINTKHRLKECNKKLEKIITSCCTVSRIPGDDKSHDGEKCVTLVATKAFITWCCCRFKRY